MSFGSIFTDVDWILFSIRSNDFKSFQKSYDADKLTGEKQYLDIMYCNGTQDTRFFVHVLENNPIYSDLKGKGILMAIATVINRNNLPCLEILISKGVPKEAFRTVILQFQGKKEENNEAYQIIRKYIE